MGRTQTLASGTTLGPYQIIRLIGVGGMGEVYEAYEPRLDRHVALKIISPEIEQEKADEIAQRFINEALNLAKINHPNVVIIYNADRVGDRHFIAMEYVDGVSLKDLLKKKRLGIDEVIWIFLQLLEGLRCLHEHKMIHRDMKPHNIVFRANGQLKILDFGIAKRMDDISDRTQAGVIVGSVPYMAPEIRTGQNATVKTDLWSVGAVMYEALVGEPLIKAMPTFGKDATKDKIGVVAFSEEASQTIPEELQLLVKRLCVPNPAKRYSTAAEVISELKRIQGSRPGGEAQGMALLAEKLASLAPRPSAPQISSVSREIPREAQREVRPNRKKERREPIEQSNSPSYAFVFFAALAAIAVGLWLGQKNQIAKKAVAPVAARPSAVAPPPTSNESLWLQYVSPRDRQILWLEDNQIVTLSWVPSLPRGDFRLVLAKDKDFVQVVSSDFVEGVSFRPDRVLTEGGYFWKLVPQRPGLKVPSIQSFSLSYVSPPEMLAPAEKQEFNLSGQQMKLPIDLAWTCKFGASQYRVQVASDLAFSKNLKQSSTSDCKYREVLAGGTYYWRTRVEEPAASLKVWSEPHEFSIKKLSAPAPRMASSKAEKKLRYPSSDKKKVVKKQKPAPMPAPVVPKSAPEEPAQVASPAALGVPTTELPRNGMSVHLSNSKAISVTFSWSEVADCESYEIEIASDAEFKKTLMRKALPEARWTYRGAEFKGKVYWRVRAQSADRSGEWSQASTFEIN